MTLAEQRAIALGAVRSQLRCMQLDPLAMSAEDAHVIVDDIARQWPDLVVSQWYRSASSYQMQLFYAEWKQWQREQQQQVQVSDHFQQMMNRLLPLE